MFIKISSAACTKEEQKTSNEVLISITNECRATIKLYNIDTGKQYLSDIFNCSYISILPIQIKPGKYKIKAETYQGKSVTKEFKKGLYSQEIDIEF